MIDWMQRHRKSLVPTMWIASIAFVGAGVVSWGQYDMNVNRATSVAKVGSENISYKEFNYKYNAYYNYFLNTSNGNFTREQAENMKLEDVALNDLIKETIFVNFAKDLGFAVNDEEVAKYITTLPQFQNDDKFDKNALNAMLRQYGIDEKDFIESLKKQLITDKLFTAITLSPSKKDTDMLLAAFLVSDKIAGKFIPMPSDVNASEIELEEFWKAHKDSYLTQKSYDLQTYFVKNQEVNATQDELMSYYDEHKSSYQDNDGKILDFNSSLSQIRKDYAKSVTNKFASKEYLKLKNSKLNFSENLLILDSDNNFPVNEISDKKSGDIVKPFEYKDGFLIVKIAKINEPKPMEFSDAKSRVRMDFIAKKRIEVLEKTAQDELKDFNVTKGEGEFVSIDSSSFMNLDERDSREFLAHVYSKPNLSGYKVLSNGAMIYKITEQKLQNDEKAKEYREVIAENASNLKNDLLRENLLEALQNRYKIEIYRGDKK